MNAGRRNPQDEERLARRTDGGQEALPLVVTWPGGISALRVQAIEVHGRELVFLPQGQRLTLAEDSTMTWESVGATRAAQPCFLDGFRVSEFVVRPVDPERSDVRIAVPGVTTSPGMWTQGEAVQIGRTLIEVVAPLLPTKGGTRRWQRPRAFRAFLPVGEPGGTWTGPLGRMARQGGGESQWGREAAWEATSMTIQAAPFRPRARNPQDEERLARRSATPEDVVVQFCLMWDADDHWRAMGTGATSREARDQATKSARAFTPRPAEASSATATRHLPAGSEFWTTVHVDVRSDSIASLSTWPTREAAVAERGRIQETLDDPAAMSWVMVFNARKAERPAGSARSRRPPGRRNPQDEERLARRETAERPPEPVPVRTGQPQWLLFQSMGDIGNVYEDATGQYPPEVEYWDRLDDRTLTYRFPVPKVSLVEGPGGPRVFPLGFPHRTDLPHPLHQYEEWYSRELRAVAASVGATRDDLAQALASDDVMARARAYMDIGGYFGFENLDSDPLTTLEGADPDADPDDDAASNPQDEERLARRHPSGDQEGHVVPFLVAKLEDGQVLVVDPFRGEVRLREAATGREAVAATARYVGGWTWTAPEGNSSRVLAVRAPRGRVLAMGFGGQVHQRGLAVTVALDGVHASGRVTCRDAGDRDGAWRSWLFARDGDGRHDLAGFWLESRHVGTHRAGNEFLVRLDDAADPNPQDEERLARRLAACARGPWPSWTRDPVVTRNPPPWEWTAFLSTVPDQARAVLDGLDHDLYHRILRRGWMWWVNEGRHQQATLEGRLFGPLPWPDPEFPGPPSPDPWSLVPDPEPEFPEHPEDDD